MRKVGVFVHLPFTIIMYVFAVKTVLKNCCHSHQQTAAVRWLSRHKPQGWWCVGLLFIPRPTCQPCRRTCPARADGEAVMNGSEGLYGALYGSAPAVLLLFYPFQNVGIGQFIQP